MTVRISARSRIATPVFAVVAVLLSLAFTGVGSAEGPGLIYGTALGGTKLVAFDLNAGKVTVIGDIGYPGSLSLAFCGPAGKPYTITNMSDPAKAQLATLNLGTGAATLVGSPLGQDLLIMGMTCSPDGILYAVGQATASPNFNSLYTVDRETGLASRVGSTGVVVKGGVYSGFFMALHFAPDGTLYGANTSALYTIDPSTAEATKVVDFSGVTMVMGLAITKDWSFYVSDYVGQSSIYALDVSTGAATSVLNSGLAKVHNITAMSSTGSFSCCVPFPKTRRTAIPVVASLTGLYGTSFKTAGQINNPYATTISGNLVFHPAGAESPSSDLALAYTLNPFETRTFVDLMAAFGTAGVGWLEIVPATGAAPASFFHIEDGGIASVPAVSEADVLVAGSRGVLVTPSDLNLLRLNIGIRSLSSGVTMTIGIYDPAATLIRTVTRTFAPNYFAQFAAADLLGGAIGVNQTIIFNIGSGSAVVYGSSAANSGGGLTLQVARRLGA